MSTMSAISRTSCRVLSFPFSSRCNSNSGELSKWSSMARLVRPVTKMICSIPEATASSTTYWTSGLSMRGSISFGDDLVAGRKRVPSPATGKIAFRTFFCITLLSFSEKQQLAGQTQACSGVALQWSWALRHPVPELWHLQRLPLHHRRRHQQASFLQHG